MQQSILCQLKCMLTCTILTQPVSIYKAWGNSIFFDISV